jgi:hypothetical protein
MPLIEPKIKYPHMLPYEAELWDRFLSIRRPPFLQLEYDVHVGDAPPPPETLPDYLVNMFKSVNMKRIDVVAHDPDVIYVVEVKGRAGLSALGQVLAYKYLYERDFKPGKPVEMRIVCERLEPNIDEIAKEHNVYIWRV